MQLVATDLDGTLWTERDLYLPPANLHALHRAASHGVVRVAITGRSLITARKALGSNIPFDYLIFSSGAGTCHWPSGEIIRSHGLAPDLSLRLVARLQREQFSFMAHRPIPDNHLFWNHPGDPSFAGDYTQRLAEYHSMSTPSIEPTRMCHEGLTELLVHVPAEGGYYERIADLVGGEAQIIRATSPFVDGCLWVEIFPLGVDKGAALSWLAGSLSIPLEEVVAIGNDFNDISMLRVAGAAYVVADGRSELLRDFPKVPASDRAGVAHVIERHL